MLCQLCDLILLKWPWGSWMNRAPPLLRMTIGTNFSGTVRSTAPYDCFWTDLYFLIFNLGPDFSGETKRLNRIRIPWTCWFFAPGICFGFGELTEVLESIVPFSFGPLLCATCAGLLLLRKQPRAVRKFAQGRGDCWEHWPELAICPVCTQCCSARAETEQASAHSPPTLPCESAQYSYHSCK